MASSEALRKGELYIGMIIDIGTQADPNVVAVGRDITDVDVANATITISGAAVTVTSGTHFIFKDGNAGTTAAPAVHEIDGLQKLVADTNNTVGGINSGAAGNSYWQNLRINAAGALTLDLMTQAFNTVRVAGGTADTMISSFGIQRALFNLLQPQVRYMDALNIKGGFKAIEYMGMPFFADRQAPFGKVFFLDTQFLKMYDTGDWDWMDEDGNILKWVTGFDAWEACLAKYCNMGVSRRNVQLLLHGLTDDPNGI